MKTNPSQLFIQFLFVPFAVTLTTNVLYADTPIETIRLQADNFEHIEFKKVKPNVHHYHDQQLQIDVDGSASFLMKPFEHVQKVNRVSFEWRSNGLPKIKNAEHEEQRPGDDAVFKLGLLLNAEEESFFNPFIPSWMKRVEALLSHPSENMIYLVANAKHSAGEKWENPYNKRVTMIAASSIDNNDDDTSRWKKTSYQFEAPVDAVGLWLMSDGDNTDSSFTAHIRNIKIE